MSAKRMRLYSAGASGVCVMVCASALGLGASRSESVPSERLLSAVEMHATLGDACTACLKPLACGQSWLSVVLGVNTCGYCAAENTSINRCCPAGDNLGQKTTCTSGGGGGNPCGAGFFWSTTTYTTGGQCNGCGSNLFGNTMVMCNVPADGGNACKGCN